MGCSGTTQKPPTLGPAMNWNLLEYHVTFQSEASFISYLTQRLSQKILMGVYVYILDFMYNFDPVLVTEKNLRLKPCHSCL